MTHIKHILLTMLLSLASITASAYDVEIDGIYYNLHVSDNTAEVTYRDASYNSYSGNVVIPETIEYKERTFSVTAIGDRAFEGCKCIQSVELPSSISLIGNWAFLGCDSLSSIEIPYSVSEIGINAFTGCWSLQSVEITDLEAWCKIVFHDWQSNPLVNAHNLLLNDELVTNLVIPNSVNSIGEYAFYDCASLQSVVIPNSVTKIGWHAFYGCSSLQSVIIPNSITEIGWEVFNGCSSLQNVEIPNSITDIYPDAFKDCSSLQSIEIPNSVATIGSSAFKGCSSLQSVVLPNSVTTIGDGAFQFCSSLQSVMLPNSVTAIGNRAFSGCTGLKSFQLYFTTPPNANIVENVSKIECIIYVPAEAVNTYKMADGWKEFWNILPIEGDVPETKQCATPSIAYANGELSFACDTEGAVYHYNIATSSCMDKEGFTEGTTIFVPTITVTAYATADGYTQSDVATATFDLDGGYKEVVKEVIKEIEKEVVVYVYDSNEPTDIALETGETMKLYLSTGKAMIVDAPMGSVISVYSNTGAMVKTLTVNDVATTIELPSDNIYIIKVGTKVFKVKV